MNRAKQIEEAYGMTRLATAYKEVQSRKMLMENNVVFPLYYFIFIIAWVIIWTPNALIRLKIVA